MEMNRADEGRQHMITFNGTCDMLSNPDMSVGTQQHCFRQVKNEMYLIEESRGRTEIFSKGQQGIEAECNLIHAQIENYRCYVYLAESRGYSDGHVDAYDNARIQAISELHSKGCLQAAQY